MTLRRLWPLAALLTFGLLYSALYLELASRWWFEDDPGQFAFTAIRSPAAFFSDRTFLRGVGAGTALAPMQFLSYWIDIRLAGFSPRFAYAHQILSFLLTLLFLYLLLERWLNGDRMAALAGCVCWALLPSTAVVVQFLAARHYLEGLLFTILAACLAGRSARMAAILCAAVAALNKETSAVLVVLLLLAIAWRRKDRPLAVLTLVLAAAYALYRTWLLGLNPHYGEMPLLTPWHFLKFLTKLPYTLSASYGGYVLAALAVLLCAYVARRRRDVLPAILLFLALAALLCW